MRLTHVARKVLQQAGHPLNTREILEIANKQGLVPTDLADAEAKMARLLARYVRLKITDIELLRTDVWGLRCYESPDVIGWPEGAKTTVKVNRFERDNRNRIACLNRHGCVCCVCGVDFGSEYGELGEGFIEVHHLTPLSQVKEGYQVNPVVDMVPVCPNCHNMMHRRNPPISPEQLRRIRKSAASQARQAAKPEQMSML
ncbi:MAG: HTH domain-containing protein [Armatimonadia bacterium]